MVDITRAKASDAGCWIDGHWGWKGTTRLLEIAKGLGFPIVKEDAAIIAVYEAGDVPTDDPEGIVTETVTELADEAEEWLNENVAPEGYRFEWVEGEFFLSPVEDEDAEGN